MSLKKTLSSLLDETLALHSSKTTKTSGKSKGEEEEKKSVKKATKSVKKAPSKKKDALTKEAPENESLLNDSGSSSEEEAPSPLPSEKMEEKKGAKKEKPAKISLVEEEMVDDSEMGRLLAQNPLEIPSIGDVLQGTVIEVGSNFALIDLGPIGTGIVLGKEMKDGLAGGVKMKFGDKVSATLLSLENDEGSIELSIRAASYEKSWEDIEAKLVNKDVVPTKVLEANKGGLMIEVNGVPGFLPVSQLASDHYPRVEDGDKNKILELLKRLIGLELRVRILDIDRLNEKLIVSEKAARSEKERAAISSLSVGDVIEGEVSGVVDFGAFVKFPIPGNEKERVEGLVHISELAWQLIDDPRTVVKTGDHVEAKVIGIEDTRISLSMKALKDDPWNSVADRYHVGDTVSGKVDKMNHFGAFVYLDKDIHGLAYVSEFQNVFPGRKMEEVFQIGNTYQWKILSMEPKSHRMGLLPVK
ncbi:MAG: S1 RNA-binding domain-containing protein [Candidatus Moraniibacteriota bacterium]|nr:MAG: S1 RNA-binding domain-containing protein [Candidatus Moranbacteria bacterium]